MSSPTASSEQNKTEIWSSRIQRELLALTTDNATAKDKKEMTQVLPAFCSVKEHALDIAGGNCTITSLLDLPAKEGASSDPITITFDVSLAKTADGAIDPAGVSYPFQKPLAIVTSGSSRFPEGSTAKDGDYLDIEMDWTPSLHLSDAILNVALKVKECLSQDEPLYAAEPKSPRRAGLGSALRKKVRGFGRKKRPTRPKATSTEVRIGDEINMLEAPWVDCQGVYSCKAIRRPKFAEEAIKTAEAKTQESPGDSEQVRSKLMDANSDQGPVPEAFGDFMRVQAGSVSQVCFMPQHWDLILIHKSIANSSFLFTI